MNKPTGYDEARTSGDFTPPETGGHYCKIIQVSETKSKTGKDMIVVLFDFCNPDRQVGYFDAQYKSDTRPKDEKKWPNNGSKYIMVHDYEDEKKTSRQFKTFCTCVEKSNNMEINWEEGSAWGKQFKGKKIGVIFGEEENEYNGKRFMRSVPKYICGWDKVADANVPEPKYLNGSTSTVSNANKSASDEKFMEIPEGSEEEIPF